MFPKGQVSFEILLLTVIILAMAIGISSYYFAIKDSTLAMQLLKVHALKKIDEADGPYTIEKIDFEEETDPDTLLLEISICPDNSLAFDAGVIGDKIIQNTKYEAVNVIVQQGTSC